MRLNLQYFGGRGSAGGKRSSGGGGGSTVGGFSTDGSKSSKEFAKALSSSVSEAADYLDSTDRGTTVKVGSTTYTNVGTKMDEDGERVSMWSTGRGSNIPSTTAANRIRSQASQQTLAQWEDRDTKTTKVSRISGGVISVRKG